MKISSKREFFEKWHQGILGNRTRLTQDPQIAWMWEAKDYGFRMSPRGVGGGAWAGVPRCLFWDTVMEWDYQYGIKSYHIDNRVPDEKQTLQGEICRLCVPPFGYSGTIGATKLPMRVAMANRLLIPRSAAETIVLINTFMDPSSRDDVDAIFDLFPEATIEFTCFSCDVGNIPGRNTMFWEVRNY